MKRQLLLLAAMLCLGGTAMAQNEEAITGNGKNVKEQREITQFTGIYVKGPFEVTISDNNESHVTLEGSQNIVSLIDVEVTDGTLKISLPEGHKFKAHKNNKVAIRIPYQSGLKNISLCGSGSIVCRS